MNEVLDGNSAAASSPAAAVKEAPAVSTEIPSDAAGYAHWRKTGEILPEKEASAPSRKSSDSSDIEASSESAAEEAEGSENAPESDPGPVAERRKHSGTPAHIRVKQLLEENKKLKGQLETRPAAPSTPADSSTAKPEAKPAPVPTELKAPVKPKLDDFKTLQEYEDARDKYAEDLADYKAESKIREFETRQRMAEFSRQMDAQIQEAKGVYPAAEGKVINEAASTIMADEAVPFMVKQRIGRSTVLPHLVYVLSSNPAEFAAFMSLAKSDPLAALDQLVLTEKLVKDELGKGKTTAVTNNGEAGDVEREDEEDSSGDVVRNAKGQFESQSGKPPSKTVTGAPPPPREASGKGKPPSDPVADAVERDDFDNYRESQNRADLARRGQKR